MCKNSEAENQIIAVDFFCGCGGMTYGINQSGVKVVLGIDNDKDVQFAYEKNNPDAEFYEADVSNDKLIINKLVEKLEKYNYKSLMFAACAPCQPFSISNQKYQDLDDKRRSMLYHFIHISQSLPLRYQPNSFIFENVGLMQSRGERILNDVTSILRCSGYNVLSPQIVNAADYGVPQNRKRLIFIAIKNSNIKRREIYNWEHFHQRYYEDKKTVREAIEHLRDTPSDGTTDPLHLSQNITDINIKRLKQIKEDGGTRDSWDESLNLECYKSHSGHKDVYGRMHWDRPAPTLTCRCTSISNGRFGHPELNRAITLREAAILQTLDNYQFKEPILITKVSKQIGNAVPSKLAKKLSLFVREVMAI